VTTEESHRAPGPGHPDGSLIVNRYRLDDTVPLGADGTGQVWRATDTLMNRVVALKQIRLGGMDDHIAARVRQQTLYDGQVATRLQHPNIVTIFDVIADRDRLWLVLEYVPSFSADTLLAAQGPFPLHLAARVGAHIAEALATAHAQGVLHRDVTPGNILIDASWNAKLTDFGIAHAPIDLQRTTATPSIPAPTFMAPEIARGENGTTTTDVYGLGATIYTLIEGTPPFHQAGPANPMRLIHQIATGQAPPPANAGPLTAVLTSMINADPSRRPDAATARNMFLAAANEIATQPANATAAGPATQPPTDGVPPWAPMGPAPSRTPRGPGPTPGATPGTAERKRSILALTVVASLVLLVIVAVVAAVLLIPRNRHTEASAQPADKYLTNPVLADACTMAKDPNYALFGTVDYTVGAWFSSCDATVVLTGGGTADVNYRVVSPQTVPGPTAQHGDLTVISPASGDPTQCFRDVVLPSRNLIVVWTTVSNSTMSPCVLSGLGTDAVIQRLRSTGSVPTVPNLDAANSLRGQNTCELLTKADVGEVSGVDTSKVYPKYGNWICYWGVDLDTENSGGAPWVNVYFERENPMTTGPDGTPQTIAGRTVFLKTENNGNDCVAQILHRRGAGGKMNEESANVSVHAAVPPDQQCHLAADLAAKMIPHLPPTG
jgi:hypothetical protein